MLVAIGLVIGYLAIFVIMKWVSWHFEDGKDQIRFHSHTERERKSDHDGWSGPKS